MHKYCRGKLKMLLGRREIDWAIACALIGAALWTYGPVISANHMIHDDYWLSMFLPADDCRLTPEWAALVLIGRILGAEITRCVAFPLYNGIGEYAFFVLSRALNVIGFALFSMLVAQLVVNLSGRRHAAAAVGLAFLATPIAVLFAAAGITATSVVSLYTTCVAIAIIVWSRRTWLQLAAAIAALTMAFAIYQIFPVYIFSVIVLIAFFAKDDELPKQCKTVVLLIIAFVIAAGMYYVLQKAIFQPLGERVFEQLNSGNKDTRGFGAAQSPAQMLVNLYNFYTLNYEFGGSLWFPYGNKTVAKWCLGVTGALAAVEVALLLRRRIRERTLADRQFWVRFAIFAIGAAGSHLLVLARADGGSHYRTGSPITLFWISVLLWSILSLVERVRSCQDIGRTAIVGGALGSCLFAQYFSVNNVLLVATNEYAYMMGAFQPILEGKTNHIQVEPPGVRGVLFHSDEFGVLSTGIGYGYSMRGPFLRAVDAYGLDKKQFYVGPYTANGVEIYDAAAVSLSGLDPALPITLKPLGRLRRGSGLKMRTIVASSTYMAFGPEHLADGSYHTAWHAAVPVRFPQFLEFTFARPEIITGVGLVAQPKNLDRGPKAIEIQGSRDGNVWFQLGSKADACTKEDGEQANVSFNPATVARVRLVVHSNCGHPQLLTIQSVEFQTK